ncbi:MAG: PA2169 family four-helix-bundle protein [Candidatus Obscuribacterales bacterium]|nr:PA2169 family four-helix-bundle protein [Candidatus Obscuribacterales bacterium]
MSMQSPNPNFNPLEPGLQPQRATSLNQPCCEGEAKELNSLLKGELSALDTYAQAMKRVEAHPDLYSVLQNARMSHEMRSRKLTQKVLDLGGEPATGAGAWGAVAKLIEGGATLFGNKAAIAALEEGEDKGLKDYENALAKTTGSTASMIQNELLPEQRRSHDAISTLKKMMS